MSTPRNREKLAAILSVAYPDLEESEVRELLSQAQAVKRGERDYVVGRCDDGCGLEIDPLRVER